LVAKLTSAPRAGSHGAARHARARARRV
jgi:hypothetical protein